MGELGPGGAELDDMSETERLTVACRDMASGMAVLSVALTRLDKRIASLEREARGLNWPQLALLALILFAILFK